MATPQTDKTYKTYTIQLKEEEFTAETNNRPVYFVRENNQGVNPKDYAVKNLDVDTTKYVYRKLGKLNNVIKYDPFVKDKYPNKAEEIADTYIVFDNYVAVLLFKGDYIDKTKPEVWELRLKRIADPILKNRSFGKKLSGEYYEVKDINFDKGYKYYEGTELLTTESPSLGNLIVFDNDPEIAYYVEEISTEENSTERIITASTDGKRKVVFYENTGEIKKQTLYNTIGSFFTPKTPKPNTGGKHKTKYNKRKSAKKQTRKHLRRRSRR